MAEKETAGFVGGHEAELGAPVDEGSLNVARTRPGLRAVAPQEDDAVFVPASPDGEVSPEAEAAAVRERSDEEDPLAARDDALRSDLTGRE